MLDSQAVKDAYHTYKVNDVALARSEYNVADAFKKSKESPVLIKALKTETFFHPIA